MQGYVFYAHAGSGNHGCEAIVRASAAMLKEKITLYSINPDQDMVYGIDQVANSICRDTDFTLKRYSIPWFKARTQTKISKAIDLEIYYRKQKMFDSVNAGDIWFSIGGDNYCYPGTDILAAERNNIQKRGAKTVLWGCSVEPQLLAHPQIQKDLSSYDLITVRESLSYEALREVNQNTVLVSDPAFTLQQINLPLPDGWIEGNMIGINASPLILENAKSGQLVFEAYNELIADILNTTDCGIVLVPHVVWKNSDDREPLTKLYYEFKDSGRVVFLGDFNCMELKGYISRCRMFVGARTHATIAAYSTCIPTLVLGYSVKSKGIAKDIFGTDKNYVLPVQTLQSPFELVDGFRWLYANEKEIRKHLKAVMPEYILKAYIARDVVRKL